MMMGITKNLGPFSIVQNDLFSEALVSVHCVALAFGRLPKFETIDVNRFRIRTVLERVRKASCRCDRFF